MRGPLVDGRGILTKVRLPFGRVVVVLSLLFRDNVVSAVLGLFFGGASPDGGNVLRDSTRVAFFGAAEGAALRHRGAAPRAGASIAAGAAGPVLAPARLEPHSDGAVRDLRAKSRR